MTGPERTLQHLAPQEHRRDLALAAQSTVLRVQLCFAPYAAALRKPPWPSILPGPIAGTVARGKQSSWPGPWHGQPAAAWRQHGSCVAAAWLLRGGGVAAALRQHGGCGLIRRSEPLQAQWSAPATALRLPPFRPPGGRALKSAPQAHPFYPHKESCRPCAHQFRQDAFHSWP